MTNSKIPDSLKDLVGRNLKYHFGLSLLLALGLRLLCLHFVWGPQALDDYLDNLIPAWKYLNHVESGLHDYRSPLYLFILAAWLKIGGWLGIENAVPQIQWVYLLQTLSSLLALLGVYRWVQTWKDSETNNLAAKASLYLVAAHFILPFASTRSFMESFAIGYTTLGVVWLAREDKRSSELNSFIWWGWILLGFSSLVRFQIGIIYVGWGAYLLARRKFKQLGAGIIVGLFLILAEALIDESFGRYPFQTLHDYFAYNADQTRAAVMPWYNTWLTWLGGAFFFPFGIIMGRHWWTAIRENLSLFCAILVYVIVHSIYPHKEERYLYPIIPLSMIFLASASAHARNGKIFQWVFQPFFWIFNTLALVVFCTVNTQVSLVGIYGDTQRVSNRVLYLDYDFVETRDWISEFFVRAPAQMIHPSELPSKEAVEGLWQQHQNLEKILLMSSSPEKEPSFRAAHLDLSNKFKCTEIFEAGSMTDKLLFAANPRFNGRRKPTLYFSCDRGTAIN